MIKSNILTPTLILCVSVILNTSIASSDHHSNNERTIKGVAVTGFNQRLGEAIWDLDELGVPTITTSFGYNPNDDQPTDLTIESPLDTLVSTGIDNAFYQAIGLTPDETFINTPLRKIPVIINSGGERAPLNSELTTSPLEPSLSRPNFPITLKKWLSAKAKAKVSCSDDGTSEVTFKFKGLIPNGVYTLWGLYGADSDSDGVRDRIVANALGGMPNVFIPNHKGKAKITRMLNYCPLDSGSGLKIVDVAYHADGNVFGAASDLGISGFPGLLAAPTHMAFPFNVTPLN